MRRFIITGAPGAGKTAIVRQLELDGFSVVEEAATDVIAAAQAQGTLEPWTDPSFLDGIANLQRAADDANVPPSRGRNALTRTGKSLEMTNTPTLLRRLPLTRASTLR